MGSLKNLLSFTPLFFLLSIAFFLHYNENTKLTLFTHFSFHFPKDGANITFPSLLDDDDLDVDTDRPVEDLIPFPPLRGDDADRPVEGLGVPEDRDGRTTMMEACNLFDGRWVEDLSSTPMYEPGSCPFVDESFDCSKNGRPDSGYTRLTWQPKACDLPRMESTEMLEMLRGKRLAYVGDSLNRNMWESLICILSSSPESDDKIRIHEVSGRKEFRTDNSYAFRFVDYNCSIEYFRSLFFVQESEAVGTDGSRKETLRLDTMDAAAAEYKDADVIVFNTAHWWTHAKTSQGKDYYQEGDHVYRQLSADEALGKALRTWGRWVDANIDTDRTRIFFRGYSSSHFGGGKWNEGGNCHGETLPVTDDAQLVKQPKLVKVIESALAEVRKPVTYLNVTRMTDYRKDAHPSMYRMRTNKRPQAPGGYQDCSHWCLPGVPDAWNKLFFAMLLKGSDGKSERI